jgi:hypothetical protein
MIIMAKRKFNFNFILCALFLVLPVFYLLLFSNPTHAQEKETYYKTYFMELGLKKDTTVEVSSYLTEGLDPDKLKGNNVLVCDSPFVYEGLFSCDYSGYELLTGEVRDISAGSGDRPAVPVLELIIQGKMLFVVPERNLVVAESRKGIESYFQAYTRASKVDPLDIEVISDGESRGSLLTEELRNIKSSSVYESVVYALWILGFVFVLGPLLVKLVHNPHILKELLGLNIYKKGLVSCLDTWVRVVIRVRTYLLLVGLFILFQLVAFLGYLSFRVHEVLDIGFISEHIANVLNPLNYRQFSEFVGVSELITLLWLLGLLVIVFLLALPRLVEILRHSYRLVLNQNVKVEFPKYAVPILILAGLTVSLFLPLDAAYTFLIFIVLGVIYLLALLQKQQVSLSDLYSKKEKTLFGMLMGFFVFTNIGYTILTQGRFDEPKYDTKDLIGVTDDMVMLPYKKEHTGYTLFKDFLIGSDLPIFVDNYLIYYPGFSKVSNRSVGGFNDVGSYLVVNPSREDLAGFILKGSGSSLSLLDKIGGEQVGNMFYLREPIEDLRSDDPDDEKDHGYYFRFVFDCTREIKTNTIRIRNYYVEGDSKVSRSERELMHFPGCGREETIIAEEVVENGTVVEEIPEGEKLLAYMVDYEIPIKFTLDNLNVYEFPDFDQKGIVRIDIIKETDAVELLEPVFFNYSSKDQLLYKNVQDTGTEFFSYYFGDARQVDLNTPLEDGMFNMSKPINVLQKGKLLNKPFVIRSLGEASIIIRRD